jgi:Periplasmic protein involved in polysaccharide export
MKKALFSIAVLLSLGLSLSVAQAQTKDAPRANFPANPSAPASKRGNKTITLQTDDGKQTVANHPSAANSTVETAEPGTVVSDAPTKSVNSLPVVSLGSSETADTKSEPPATDESSKTSSEAKPAESVPATILTFDPKPVVSEPKPAASVPAPVITSDPNKPAPEPSSIYRVGVGDVLDIQLLNSPTRESTLYTVLANGLLEYPLAGEAGKVAGLTTEEIGAYLTSKIKLYDKPQVAVSVREYASHNVIITGLVHEPGTKALRREAVPLFVVLAEAQPRADAARAVIMRTGSPTQTIDISDTTATSVLVYPNDVIRLVGAPPPAPQFFFIGGQIASPGQKDFHKGLTLTQAILASGGVTRFASTKVKVMRQGADGRLATTEYNLKKIEQGKDPDPLLEAGDRIEVARGGW